MSGFAVFGSQFWKVGSCVGSVRANKPKCGSCDRSKRKRCSTHGEAPNQLNQSPDGAKSFLVLSVFG